MSLIAFDIEVSDDVTPHYNRETIEIKAVKIMNNEIVDDFQIYIKPEYIDNISSYCTAETGITMDVLSNSPCFNSGILEFYSFIYGSEIVSFGERNRKFLIRELREKGNRQSHMMIENAIQSSHINLQKHFFNVTNVKAKTTQEALNYLGLTPTSNNLKDIIEIYLSLERMRVTYASKFTKGNIKRMANSIMSKHKRHVDTHDVMKLIDEWSDLMLVDQRQGNKYLTLSEMNILNKLNEMRLESGSTVQSRTV